MNDIPSHSLPSYTGETRDDALFHYTTAAGLIGILRTKEIWATAYYCSNDASELAVGRGILADRFSGLTLSMIEKRTPLIRTFYSRGVDPMDYAKHFEQLIIGMAFNQFSTYMSCFCKPNDKEDFLHGLLSQWRAYGIDGGYALQLSRKKLLAAIEKLDKKKRWQFDLKDVFYTTANPLREKVLDHISAFTRAYIDHLEQIGRPLSEVFNTRTVPNPIGNLLGGPIEALLDYLIHTKNGHFSEERECRLSLVEAEASTLEKMPTYCFDRGGLIVPYKTITDTTIPLADCIEWIVIGPSSRMNARFKSVCQIVQSSGLNIKVRPSHIPFVRS